MSKSLWAAWHPENGFGPIDEISIRKTMREADEDAGIYNYSGGNNDWRPVEVKIVRVVKSNSRCLGEVWQWGGG